MDFFTKNNFERLKEYYKGEKPIHLRYVTL